MQITPKVYNLQRPVDTKHKQEFLEHETKESRVDWYNSLFNKFKGMKNGLKKYLGRSEIITKAALKIAHIILSKQKPFSDGEVVLIKKGKICCGPRDFSSAHPCSRS